MNSKKSVRIPMNAVRCAKIRRIQLEKNINGNPLAFILECGLKNRQEVYSALRVIRT